MPEGPSSPPAPRLAILSYSSGEFDGRSFRIAASAIAAGYSVTMYSRWRSGQALHEDREGYTLHRVAHSWLLGIPGLRGWARRRLATRIAESERIRASASSAPRPGATAGVRAEDGGEPGATPARTGTASRLVRWLTTPFRRWVRVIWAFPLRPLGWAEALEPVAPPADIWHGMWSGSLPALKRLKARHGGRTIYDSRDVYMLSRDFYRLEWPLRPILAWLERRWAHDADLVLTVNDAYADLLIKQLDITRPPVVLNCPDRWDPPVPPPDLLREAIGAQPSTRIVLYQGQLISGRGIEQAMDAIVDVPDAVLCLLGYGQVDKYRELAADPRYGGRVRLVPPVVPSELLAWSASADVMVMAIQPTSVNHRFTTPQKLWEAIAAGVPIVASDLPGMAGVITEAGVGVLCDPESPASIAAALRRILDASPEERAALRSHVLRVGQVRYTWNTEAAKLLDLYAGLASRR